VVALFEARGPLLPLLARGLAIPLLPLLARGLAIPLPRGVRTFDFAVEVSFREAS